MNIDIIFMKNISLQGPSRWLLPTEAQRNHRYVSSNRGDRGGGSL